MATKKQATKKTLKKVAKRAADKAKPKVAVARKTAKKTATKAVKQAKGLLGKLAQKSAQLILDSGLLGSLPEGAPSKQKRRAKT